MAMRLFFFCIIWFGIGLLHNCESLFDFCFRICRDIRDQNLLPAINAKWSRQEILTLPIVQILDIVKHNPGWIFAKLSLSRVGSSLNLPKITFWNLPNQRWGESPINDTGSWWVPLKNSLTTPLITGTENRLLFVLMIRRVGDSPCQRYGKSTNPPTNDMGSARLSVSVIFWFIFFPAIWL